MQDVWFVKLIIYDAGEEEEVIRFSMGINLPARLVYYLALSFLRHLLPSFKDFYFPIYTIVIGFV